MASKTYKDQVDQENIQKLRNLLNSMPAFCGTYFRSLEATKSTRTRLSYAYDLNLFFSFLKDKNPAIAAMDLRHLPIDVLDQLSPIDIEEYLSYLQSYDKNGVTRTNKDHGILRKLSALRSMFQYFFKKGMIQSDISARVEVPKLHTKNIVRLDPDEVATMLDPVESGEKLTPAQLRNHAKTKLRDVAIVTLLLGTGIRVSECVGLNLTDIDFKNNKIRVVRKGGNEDIVYFSEEVAHALSDYLELDRANLQPAPGHEDAVFISLKNQRLTVRSVERLVKKYASNVTTLKKITPHKLRSTYGTNLYRETGDIYLVADVLGHTDVNTTKKHYAAIQEDRKRSAANVVKLREP